MISLYHDGQSVLHRTRPGMKLVGLIAFSTLVFFIPNLIGIFTALALIVALYGLARFDALVLMHQLRAVWLFVAIIFAFQWFLASFESALFTSVRLITLILAASLMTLTTKPTDLIAAMEKGLQPFDRFINVSQFSLAVALVLRFIPLVAQTLGTIRQAQKARGGGTQIWQAAGPAIIHTLKMADEVAEAIDARSFDARGAS